MQDTLEVEMSAVWQFIHYATVMQDTLEVEMSAVWQFIHYATVIDLFFSRSYIKCEVPHILML